MSGDSSSPMAMSPNSEPLKYNDAASLTEAPSEAAETFAQARTQAGRLWSLHEYLAVVRHALATFSPTLQMLEPHNALSQALATQAAGSPHPLPATAKVDNRPKSSPVRLVEQIVAVLTSHIFHRAGFERGKADEAAARLVSGLGVNGRPNRNLTKKTLTKWRLDASQFGDNREVGIICDHYLDSVALRLNRFGIPKAADF